MAKFWKSKTLLAKIETTYGTDAAPTGAANAILALDVSFSPQEGEVVKRNVARTFFAADPFVAMAFRSTITFSVDLVGSGAAGTAPGWGPLLRACGVAQVVTAGSKVEYSPITDNPESLSLYFDVDGTKHLMLGARGTGVLKLGASGNPMITFTFTSLFTVPVEAAKPTPNFASWQAPQAASKANTPTFTIGGTPFVARDYELGLGVKVEPRMLIGYEGILITGKEESLKLTVEAVPMGTYNPAQMAVDGTQQAISVLHGTIVGRKVQIDVPYAQQLPVPQYQEQQGIVEWSLPFVPQPSAGNDQWKITLT